MKNNLRYMILIIFSVFFITSCMTKDEKSVSATIDFWTFPNFTSESGKAGDFEQSLIDAFRKENPSIKINFKLLSFADGGKEIQDAIDKGNPPDIIYDAPGRILLWANSGLLEPLDDVLATEKPYITVGLLAVSAGKDRRSYMYPIHCGPFSMAFNKEMLEDLGLIDLLPYTRRDRQWTLGEYEKLLSALRSKLPSEKTPGVFFYKTQGGDQGTRAFLVNLYGNARLLNGDYSQYVFNTPNAVKNLDWTVKAMKTGLLFDGKDMTSNDAIQMFVESNAAHTILYSPQLNKMYDGKRNYKGKDFTPIYMPFPNSSSAPVLEFLAGGACIFKTTNKNRTKAAKKFLHFMATDEVWAQKVINATGGFPASSKVSVETKDPEILYNSVLQRFYGQYYNNINGFGDMRGYWNTALKNAASGKDIQSVLDVFVRDSNNSLKK